MNTEKRKSLLLSDHNVNRTPKHYSIKNNSSLQLDYEDQDNAHYKGLVECRTERRAEFCQENERLMNKIKEIEILFGGKHQPAESIASNKLRLFNLDCLDKSDFKNPHQN
mmetsp:Transcript_157/g.174  ORF Transcript_157/g.174 Transcript_157/m.174 type:complete len:110 (-) Transcript_157:7-336(-)